MGKNGERLRAEKAQKVTYTFTKEELEAHDRLVISSRKDHIRSEMDKELFRQLEQKQAEVDEYIAAEWKKREEIFGGTHEDNLLKVLQLLLATSSCVLIEHFGWRPIPKSGRISPRNKTKRFAEYLVDEINKITDDENADIRRYCEDVFEKYGVGFKLEDADEETEEEINESN